MRVEMEKGVDDDEQQAYNGQLRFNEKNDTLFTLG